MRVTKSAVIKAASEIADADGLNNVSLKVVAEKLNIRTPSLYNHIASIDDLLREVAHNGMLAMNAKMTQSAIGKAGDTAIKSISVEYFQFMIEHPGVYETIQWATWHGNDETAKIFCEYKTLLTTLILSCGFKEQDANEILDLIMGVLHGYTTLQLRFALINPDKSKADLCNAIDTILIGAHLKYK